MKYSDRFLRYFATKDVHVKKLWVLLHLANFDNGISCVFETSITYVKSMTEWRNGLQIQQNLKLIWNKCPLKKNKLFKILVLVQSES